MPLAPGAGPGGPADPAAAWRRLAEADGDLAAAIAPTLAGPERTVSLLAGEGGVCPAVRAVRAVLPPEAWTEGLHGARLAPGGAAADAVEALACRRLRALLGGDHASVQAHSVTVARLAALAALARPGDTVLAPDPRQGGAHAYGGPLSPAASRYRFVHCPADRESGALDLDMLEDLAREHRPAVVVSGGTAGPLAPDHGGCAAVARAVGARLLADLGPFAGAAGAGLLPNPVGLCDAAVLCTGPALRGPRGGAIVCRAEYGRAVDRAVWPGLQDAVALGDVAAKAACFAAAREPEGVAYQRRVLENAAALAAALRGAGLRLVGEGTATHIAVLDLRGLGLSGRAAERACEQLGLFVQRAPVPSDPLPPPRCSGLRLATLAVTSRGMGPAEMGALGSLLGDALHRLASASAPEWRADPPADLVAAVAALAAGFPDAG